MSDKAILIKDEAGVFVRLEPSPAYPGRYALTCGVEREDGGTYMMVVVGDETLLQLRNHVEYLLSRTCTSQVLQVTDDYEYSRWKRPQPYEPNADRNQLTTEAKLSSEERRSRWHELWKLLTQPGTPDADDQQAAGEAAPDHTVQDPDLQV